jgi:transposase
VRAARRVRAGGPGKRAGGNTGTASWADLTTHISAAMRAFTGAHPDWLTIVQVPAYAPDLNAVEGAWANIKDGLGNLAAADTGQLTAIIKNRLKSIQYRPALIDAFLAQNRAQPRTSATVDLSLSTGCNRPRVSLMGAFARLPGTLGLWSLVPSG